MSIYFNPSSSNSFLNLGEENPSLCNLIESGASAGTILAAIEATPGLSRAEFLNRPNDQGLTPLMIASSQGDRDLAELLLEQGAEVHRKSNDGSTALHLAASRDNAAIIGVLLKHGADIGGSNNVGKFALYLAAENGCLNAVRKLLEAGADISQDRKSKVLIERALDDAAQQGHYHVIEVLLSFKDAFSDDDLALALYHACENGHVKAAEMLIHAGADVGGIDGYIPLEEAIVKGHTELVRLLLKNGAFRMWEKREIDGDPLKLALKCSHLQIIDALLEAKIQDSIYQAFLSGIENGKLEVIDWALQKGMDKGVALVKSAKKGNVQAMDLLLKKGIEIDVALGRDRHTALHSAAKGGSVHAVEFLLRRGAKLEVLNKKGKSPLDFAIENKRSGVIRTLFTAGAKLDDEKKSQALRAVSKLFMKTRRGFFGRVMLVDKLQLEDIRLVKFLMEKGADSFDCVKSIEEEIKPDVEWYWKNLCHRLPELVSLIVEYLPRQLSCKLDQLSTADEGIEALRKKMQQLSTFIKKLQLEILPWSILINKYRKDPIPQVSLNPILQRALTLQAECQTLITKIEQENKGFKEAEKEFDGEDVFGLLTAFGGGVAQEIVIQGEDGAQSKLKFNPQATYDNLFHAKQEDFWLCGLRNGSDLRMLGVDRTISHLLSYEMKKDPEGTINKLSAAIDKKIQLFEMLQSLGYRDLYNNDDDRIKDILTHLKTVDLRNEKTRDDLSKWEVAMGQVLLRAFFSQGVAKVIEKLKPLNKSLSELQGVYSKEDFFSFLREEKKRSRD